MSPTIRLDTDKSAVLNEFTTGSGRNQEQKYDERRQYTHCSPRSLTHLFADEGQARALQSWSASFSKCTPRQSVRFNGRILSLGSTR